ncbi:MAG TPA: energy transducer TonB [Xanthobacteraceae bacterium]|nr:energy transducer TonB [Xanthobacteraceae bacterium]
MSTQLDQGEQALGVIHDFSVTPFTAQSGCAMTSLATQLGNSRHDLMRWGACFAVVMAAHGAAALALLLNPASDSDFDAGAPVVMIELPEASGAFATPQSDLAPGPTEPEREQTPAPKEETKPPEDVAEVALPVPEPPKPEPPADEKPPTAPPSIVMPPTPSPPVSGATVQPSAALVRRWESALVAHIERFKRYPAEARTRGEQGSARVAFTIDREGWVRESRIVQTSGSPELDQESLAMLTRAQPMPKPPNQVKTSELSFVVPIRFHIR